MVRGRPTSLRGTLRPVKDKATGKVLRYEATINLGKDSTGKYRREVLSARTRKEAQAKLDARIAAIEHEQAGASDLTTRVFFDEWLAFIKAERGGKTYASYEGVVRLHIRPRLCEPFLDKPLLTDFTLQDGRRIIHAIREEKGPSRILEYSYSMLMRALNDAVQWGYIDHNPIRPGDIEIERYTKHEAIIFSLDEIATLLQVVRQRPRGEMFVLMYGLIFFAGFRHGEVLGLGYDDLDPRRKAILVTGAVHREHGKNGRFKPKTEHARRTIWIHESFFDALWSFRDTQRPPDAWWNPLRLLFTTKNGTPFSQENFFRHYKSSLRLANLPEDARIHDGRHTHASLLVEGDVHPKIAQAILGHAKIATTMDIYSHVRDGRQQRGAFEGFEQAITQVWDTPGEQVVEDTSPRGLLAQPTDG